MATLVEENSGKSLFQELSEAQPPKENDEWPEVVHPDNNEVKERKRQETFSLPSRRKRTKQYHLRERYHNQPDEDKDVCNDEESLERLENLPTKDRKLEYRRRLFCHEENGTLNIFRRKENRRLSAYNAALSGEKLERWRELARQRQKTFRERQKVKELSSKTRHEVQKLKEERQLRNKEAALRMRKKRSALTEEEKAAINAARQQKYRERKSKTQTQTQVTQTKGTSEDKETTTMPGSPSKTPEALRKATSRFLANSRLPKQATKYAQIQRHVLLRAMICPKMKRALEKEGIIIKRRKYEVQKDHLFSGLKGLIQKLKSKKDRKSTLTRKSIVRAMTSTTTNTSWLSRTLACRRQLILNVSSIPEEEEELHKTRNALAEEDQIRIMDFYARSDISTMVPDRKKIKRGEARAFLNKPLKELHKEFKKDTGSSVSLTNFSKNRPAHILKVTQANHISCLCEMCAKLSQKLTACKKEMRVDLGSLHVYIKSTMCPSSDLPHRKCFERWCALCGFGDIRAKLFDANVDLTKEIKWLKWGRLDGQKRVTNNEHQGTAADFLNQLESDTTFISKHVFIAKGSIGSCRN